MKILALMLVVTLVGVIVACVRTKKQAADPDQIGLDQLQKTGLDLTKPHQFEFFLYFPSKESAQKVAEVLQPDGFAVEVRPAAKGPEWLCSAKKEMVPLHYSLLKVRERFETLAQQYHGEYDGWETAVEK